MENDSTKRQIMQNENKPDGYFVLKFLMNNYLLQGAIIALFF